MSTTRTGTPSLTPEKAESRYGVPLPRILVHMPVGSHYRQVQAALHRLAAEIELATPPGEAWSVGTEVVGDERGYVYLELGDGTEAEADRGFALLQSVVG